MTAKSSPDAATRRTGCWSPAVASRSLGQRVAILTVFATDEAAIDEKKAEEARARAEARLKEKDKLSPEEITLVQASMAHSLAQLKYKRRTPR